MTFTYQDAHTPNAQAYVAEIPSGITDALVLLAELRDRLALPGYFGMNWNALSDCLRDLHWLQQPQVVLCHADLPGLPEADLRNYLEVLAEAVQSWQPNEPHSLQVIFPQAAREQIAALVPQS